MKTNGLGGFVIRQSDLSAWSRCQMQKHYTDQAKLDPANPQPAALSASVYGTVIHYALMNLEKMVHEDNPDAVEIATETFLKFWHPQNIGLIAEPVTVWLPRQTYSSLREAGRRMIRDYARLLASDPSIVLSLEHQFNVPLHVDGTQHTLHGTVDRLTLRRTNNRLYIGVDDYKSAKRPTYLRHNIQGTAYAYATTQPEFWESFPPETVGRIMDAFAREHKALHIDHATTTGLPLASRRFRWIDLKENRHVDGGWRCDKDYARLKIAVDQYVKANEAGIYSINTTGEVCFYCPFKKTCAGVGIPDDSEGNPY